MRDDGLATVSPSVRDQSMLPLHGLHRLRLGKLVFMRIQASRQGLTADAFVGCQWKKNVATGNCFETFFPEAADVQKTCKKCYF